MLGRLACRRGRDVIFEALPRLAAKAEVIYQVQVRGMALGNTFRTRVRADSLKEPLVREESTRILQRRRSGPQHASERPRDFAAARFDARFRARFLPAVLPASASNPASIPPLPSAPMEHQQPAQLPPLGRCRRAVTLTQGQMVISDASKKRELAITPLRSVAKRFQS